MIKSLFSIGRVAVLAALAAICSGELLAQPGADELLKRVRQGVTTAANKDMKGQMRKRGLKVPFTMSLRGDLISFLYLVNQQSERFDLKFNDSSLSILFLQNGKMVRLPEKFYAQPIGGTDVSYDDLSMRFLYWKNGTVLPQDSTSVVKGRDCWVVQVKNPSTSIGEYAWVRVWIDKEEGGILQIDGINKNGELSKRFIINSISRLDDGSCFFKQMKLEVRDSANSKRVISTSYIEMDS